MSGTASRFQQRFGYGPGLRLASGYPGQAPSVLPPTQPGVAFPQTPAVQPPQPAQPQQPAQPDPAPPVSAGSAVIEADPTASGPEGDGHNATNDLGPNPGDLSGLAGAFGFGTGFGLSNYGQIGGIAGTVAGGLTGVPGLGFAGSVIGSLADVDDRNGMLSASGLAPNFGLESAISAAFNSSTYGLGGRSLDAQLAQQLGIPAPGTQYGLPGHDLDLPGAEMAQAKDPNAPNDGMISDAVPDDQKADLSDKPEASTDTSAPGGEAKGADPANTPGSMPGSSVPGHSGVEESGSEGQGGQGSPDYGGGVGGGSDGYNRDGGYTGSGPDNTVQPWREAGIVHEGEVVIPAHRVAEMDPYFLMDLVGPGGNWRNMSQTSRLAALAGLD